MNDAPSVEVVSDSSGKNEFAKALSYRNGNPRKKRVVLICLCLMMVILVPALLLGPPGRNDFEPDGSFAAPQVTTQSTDIRLPQYNRAGDLSQKEAQVNRRQSYGQGKRIKLLPPQLLKRPRHVKIPPGSMVKAKLLSGASNGLVTAQLSESLIVNGETLVEAGTKTIGAGASSRNRLFIKFNKLVHEDGTIEGIGAEAADESDKTMGLKGSQVGLQAVRLGAGIGLNFAGGVAEGLQETEGQQGVAIKKNSMKNALLNGAAKASLDQSREMLSELRNEAPIIEVPEGTNFYLVFFESGD